MIEIDGLFFNEPTLLMIPSSFQSICTLGFKSGKSDDPMYHFITHVWKDGWNDQEFEQISIILPKKKMKKRI